MRKGSGGFGGGSSVQEVVSARTGAFSMIQLRIMNPFKSLTNLPNGKGHSYA